MGKAQDRVEELTKQITELTKEREIAIAEAQQEKIQDLNIEKAELEKSINALDQEWQELKKSLKGKDRRFNLEKSRLVEVETELDSFKNS